MVEIRAREQYSQDEQFAEKNNLVKESTERKEVKMCKHCFKPFIAKNLNSDYDTASCRNVANVYRSRAKNK